MSATTGAAFPGSTSASGGEDIYTAPGVGTGSEAGASGDSSANSVSISQGGIVAIIVVVVVVSVIGGEFSQSYPAARGTQADPKPAATALLFFMAKKREWKVREKIRRSARKVVTALTPRRSEFPSSVKGPNRGRTKVAENVPPTPRIKINDLEKGNSKVEIESQSRNWSRKL